RAPPQRQQQREQCLLSVESVCKRSALRSAERTEPNRPLSTALQTCPGRQWLGPFSVDGSADGHSYFSSCRAGALNWSPIYSKSTGPVHSEHQDELACGCGWPVVFLISARRVFSGCKMSIDPVVFWVSRDIFGA